MDELREQSPSVAEKVEKGLSEDAKKISPDQARALSIFAFEAGLSDLTFLNLFFTNSGKIAVIDTEPVKRNINKNFMSSLFNRLFLDKGIFKTNQSCLGVAKLRLSISDNEALNAIKATENYYLAICAVKTVAKAAFIIIAWRYSSTILNTFVFKVIKVGLSIKIGTLFIQSFNLLLISFLGRKENGSEMAKLLQVERLGGA